MSFPYKCILCPVDFDDNSIWAVNEAGALARSGEGEVCLLHVVQINPLATEGFVLGELQGSQIELARGKLEDIGKQAVVDFRRTAVFAASDCSPSLTSGSRGFAPSSTLLNSHSAL